MKRIILVAAIVIVVLVAALVAAPFLIDANRFKPTLEAELGAALGRKVTFGNLKLALLSQSVTANDLGIAEDPAFGKGAFVKAKSLGVGVELVPLIFSKQLHVTGITIDRPEISLIQAASGDWNYSTLGTSPASPAGKAAPKTGSAPAAPPPASGGTGSVSPMDVSVKLVKITNGKFALQQPGGRGKPLILDPVNIEVRDFRLDAAVPFSLSAKVVGGGAIQMNGKAGPLNRTDASMTPLTAAVNASAIDLAGSGLNSMAPDIAGIISLDGNLQSNGNTATIDGKFKGEKLKLAKGATPASVPVGFDFAILHQLRKNSGTLRQGVVHVGKAVARLTGDYAEQGDAMLLKMKFSGPDMAVEELAAMLPALAIILPNGSSLQGGTLSTTAALEGPADKLNVNGTVALNKTKLANFDLGKNMAAIQSLAGMKGGPDTEIETASAALRATPAGTAVDDIRFVVPAMGELYGAGTISPANALDFKMTAKVHTSGSAAALADRPIPFFVTGTSAAPVFRPDLKALGTEAIREISKSGKPGDILKDGKVGEAIKGLFGGKK